MQKHKKAREIINEFIELCNQQNIGYEILTDVSIHNDSGALYAMAKATVSMNGTVTNAHKLFYQKEPVGAQKDSTFAAAAETIAVARAIALITPTDELTLQEEFDELILFTVKRISELFQINTRSAKEYVQGLQNDVLRERASVYLESLFTKASMQGAVKP